MKRIWIAAALLLALLLCACGNSGAQLPPPELRGVWRQTDTGGAYYQFAVIADDAIEVFWHVNKDGSEYLYWSGSFVPPENGREPYAWASENNYARTYTSNRARREETLTFTYKNGQLSFVQIQGHIHIGIAMEKVE